MTKNLIHISKLLHAGLVLLHSGLELAPPGEKEPFLLRLARILTSPFSLLMKKQDGLSGVSAAFARLGPSYIKLGQFLATRQDIVGEKLANDFTKLQDQLPPFEMRQAQIILQEQLGAPVHKLFEELSEPLAAASIAQVHKGTVSRGNSLQDVAVKVLRPDVEKRFRNDLQTFYLAARSMERFDPASKRLRPIAVVDTLAHSVSMEMDLRLEAAAISEMSENIKNDIGFRLPEVDWERTSQKVLTTEWIYGTPLNDLEALKVAGHDLKELGERVMQTFLLHAMRDGFFHADMHQGNLFVEPNGTLVAIDFGIMGRLGNMEKRYLAEIIYGFVKRDYQRAAEFHFEAGYVPPHHSVGEFAQALRAVGEPIQDKPADEVSMGNFLGQLFQYTEVFEMQTRPELLMLQKTMVVVEGVARSLNPKLNMWRTAEPVVSEWMKQQLGPQARLQDLQDNTKRLGKFASQLPDLLEKTGRISTALDKLTSKDIEYLENNLVSARQNRASEYQRTPSAFSRLCLFILMIIAGLLIYLVIKNQ